MTSTQSPPWALIAGALDGVGDSHLPSGIHVRVLPSARLGLPATPLEVMRAVISSRELLSIARKGEVTWIDSAGKFLVEPFQVTPDNPVFGYFPDEAQVVWAMLETRPATQPTSAPTFAPTAAPTRTPPPFPRPTLSPGPIPGPLPNPIPGPFPQPTPLPTPRPPIPAVRDTLRFDALADTVNGPTVIQSDAGAPYVLAHVPIPRVRVSGRGTVGGIRWVEAVSVRRRQFGLWEWWSLPVHPAPRYHPTPNARDEAHERVKRGAVQREPMHVAWTASDPMSAPVAGAVEAEKRLDQVRHDLDRWLNTLHHDMSRPTWELTESQALAKQPGAQDGTMGLGIEKFLLIASIDPDVGHYLGLGGVDERVDADPGALVIYQIRGLYHFNSDAWTPAEMASLAPALRENREAAIEGFPNLKKFELAPAGEGPFLDLFGYAVAAVGQPAQGMRAPSIGKPDERGWLSTPPPPEVRRAVRLVAGHFHAPAVAAVAARDQYGERTLHAFPGGARMKFGSDAVPAGMPLAWVVSQPQDAKEAGQGRFEDRFAPASKVFYRIARGDWFGRWSGWGKAEADPPPRTVPARPALLLNVIAPSFAPPPAPPPAGLLSSTIDLGIPMPELGELPAGGAALAQLELVETFGSNPTVTVPFTLGALPAGAKIVVDPSSSPGQPQHVLKITRVGPALPPAGQSQVVYTARWRDVLGQVSADAFPASKTVLDPRPPAAPVIVRPLSYTARPDSLGHARVEFAFPGAAGVGYRVYASTETTLLKALEDIDATLAGNIANTALINDRAGALVDHKGLFGWDHFELVSPEPLYRDGSGQVRFTHRVSGGLNVAVFYRVVAEGPHGGLSELSDSSMFAFGVPNVGGPGQPLLSVVSRPEVDPVTGGVRLRVKVPHGASRPAAWRLRRTSTPLADPLKMPIVLAGTLPAADPLDPKEDEGYIFEIDAPAPLKAWVSYRFVVEVQGEAPPGAVDVVGEWGEASAPVKLAVMPPSAPKAPQGVVVSVEGAALRVAVSPQALETWGSTMMGSYTFETWRSTAGDRPTRVPVLYSFDAASGAWRGLDPTPLPAAGTTSVSVRVLDPLGRASAPTTSNTI